MNATMMTTPTEMIQAAQADPALFAQLILQGAERYRPLAEVHLGLHRHLSAHHRALVELPRDHGKTTQVCLRIVWELGRKLKPSAVAFGIGASGTGTRADLLVYDEIIGVKAAFRRNA